MKIIKEASVKPSRSKSALIAYIIESEEDACKVMCIYEVFDGVSYSDDTFNILKEDYSSTKKAKLLVDNGDIKALKSNLKDCESIGNKTPRTYKGGRMSTAEVAMKKEKVDTCYLYEYGRWSLFEGGF